MPKRRTHYIIFFTGTKNLYGFDVSLYSSVFPGAKCNMLVVLFLPSLMNSSRNTDKGKKGGLISGIQDVLLKDKRNYRMCLPKSNFCDLSHANTHGTLLYWQHFNQSIYGSWE